MKNTPGPWEADLTGKYYQPCVRHNGMIVCLMPKMPINMGGVDERFYDSHLIAAAPEMLEALLCINAVLNQNKTFPKDLEYIQRVANDAINTVVGKE